MSKKKKDQDALFGAEEPTMPENTPEQQTDALPAEETLPVPAPEPQQAVDPAVEEQSQSPEPVILLDETQPKLEDGKTLNDLVLDKPDSNPRGDEHDEVDYEKTAAESGNLQLQMWFNVNRGAGLSPKEAFQAAVKSLGFSR